jgi:hypothetical protein
VEALRSGARRLRWWTTLLILFVAAVMVLEIAARAGAFGAADPPYRLGLDLLFAIPILIYLGALWRVRRAFSAIAEGALFTPEVATAMRHVGLLLTAGAGAAFVINPYLHRLAADDYPRLVEFDVATLVIGAVGIALTFIARLFDQAVRLQREMDEIF